MSKTKEKLKVVAVDLNGKPIDWSKTLMPDDLADKCLAILRKG